MRTPHTAFPKMSKIYITLRNGESFVDKFLDKKNGCVILQEAGRLKIELIKCISFFKHPAKPKNSKNPEKEES